MTVLGSVDIQFTDSSSNVWIVYGDDEQGTNLSTSPIDKQFMGIAYNKKTNVPSINPLDYSWSKITGTEGVPGPPGVDGKTSYMHFAYADDSNGGGLSQSPTNKAYMGTYVDYSQNDSTDPTKYKWALIQGPAGPQGLQGLQGLKGDQGIQGTTGADGVSSYTHIAYSTSANGSIGFSVSDSVGKTYIGMYVDNVATDSTNPSMYKWTLIKGADGSQGIQGPTGADGKTSYLHIAYALNSTGTSGFSITDPTSKTYMGTYTDFTSADSTDPSKYKWALIQGPAGPQGPQGLQGIQGSKGDQGIEGAKGANGVSSYTHIAYAQNSTGTLGFSTSGDGGATYIGMYVDTFLEDSTDPSKYKWTLIKGADGAQGIQGPSGSNGQTPYLHIAYSTSADGSVGFSITDTTGKTYIGTYTDYSQNDSTDPTKYKWALIQGPQGVAGKGISSVTEYYLASTASSGVTTATAGWTTTIQTITTTNKYLWNYEKITYTDGSTSTTTPVIIGTYGTAGKGISSITEYYLATSSASGVTTATAGWTTTMQTLTSTNKYLWNYEKITYSDATTSTTTPVIIGVYGDTGAQGPQGNQGVQGPTGTSQYVYIRYSANADGSGMTSTAQSDTAYVGIAVATAPNAPPSLNTDYSWSLFKGPQGSQGVQGPNGADGQPTYTWVKYAIDEYGGNMGDTPSGKRYIGLAFNKTTATESTNVSDYQWSPLYDNVIIGSRNLYLDSYLERVLSYSAVSTLAITDSNESLGNLIKVTHNGVSGDSVNFGFKQDVNDQKMKIEAGKKYALNFKARGNVGNFAYTYMMRDSAEGTNSSFSSGTTVILDATKWTPVVLYKDGPWDTSTGYMLIGSSDGGAGKWFEVKDVKLEQGNVASDWTPAPEDLQSQIDNKTSSGDFDAIAGAVSLISSQLDGKTDYGEFKAMKDEYDAFIAQNIVDAQAVSTNLATMDGRVALVETLAGNNKIVTDFINTVITESEEGIYISNGASSTGILIASDRISFMDNNVEVAYISNQTMQINHGIFVESAIISDFKFEKIPGTTILSITWVGD